MLQTVIVLLTRQRITLSGPYSFLSRFNAFSNAISGYRAAHLDSGIARGRRQL